MSYIWNTLTFYLYVKVWSNFKYLFYKKKVIKLNPLHFKFGKTSVNLHADVSIFVYKQL